MDGESSLSQFMHPSSARNESFQARTEREMRLQGRVGRSSLAVARLLVSKTLKVRK